MLILQCQTSFLTARSGSIPCRTEPLLYTFFITHYALRITNYEFRIPLHAFRILSPLPGSTNSSISPA